MLWQPWDCRKLTALLLPLEFITPEPSCQERVENPIAIPYPASGYTHLDTYVWEWCFEAMGKGDLPPKKLRFCGQQEHLDGLSVLSMLPWWPQRQRNTIIWESDWLAVLYSSSLIPSTFVAETLPTLTSSSRFFFCCWNWPAWMLMRFYTRQSEATCWIVFIILHFKVSSLLLWWQHSSWPTAYRCPCGSMFSYVVNTRGPGVFVACTKRAKPAGGEKCAFLTRNKAVFALESATEWTASVHTLNTCPNLQCNPCSKCYGMDCFGTYFKHMSKPAM